MTDPNAAERPHMLDACCCVRCEDCRREFDPTPIDEAFARSVGEYGEYETIGGKKARYVRVAPNATIWISGYPIRLEVETARIDNPTIGDFFTAARLFKVQLKEGGVI